MRIEGDLKVMSMTVHVYVICCSPTKALQKVIVIYYEGCMRCLIKFCFLCFIQCLRDVLRNFDFHYIFR